MSTALVRRKVRAYAGPPVARRNKPATLYSAQAAFESGAVQTRDRKGRFFGSNALQGSSAFRYRTHHRVLTPEELFQVYRLVPDVRSSVDGIVRRVSTYDWNVNPAVKSDNPQFDLAVDLAEETRRFLAAPNNNGETWQTLLSKAGRDLLTYDALAIEIVSDSSGQVEELVAWNGGYIEPVLDGHAQLLGYSQQNPGDTEPVFFQPDELLYLNLFPNTVFPGGTPIPEAIVNEFLTTMAAGRHLLLAYDADEVAPGILFVAGLGKQAAERMKDSLRNTRGQDHKIRLITTNNPKALSANWIELRHTPKELDLREIIKDTRRIIWRAYGRMPVTMGDTEATPRATAEVQLEADDSILIEPILEELSSLINIRLIPRLVGDPALASLIKFEFDFDRKLTPSERNDRADEHSKLIDRGAMTINESRMERGEQPMEGGDVPIVKVGGTSGYAPLGSVLAGTANAVTDASADTDADTDTDGGADASDPEQGEEGPGEIDAESRPRHGHRRATKPTRKLRGRSVPGRPKFTTLHHHDGCGCEPRASHRQTDSDLLPSDWQPEGRFKDVRTLDLPDLASSIIDYNRTVFPLYDQARREAIAAFRSEFTDGRLDASEAQRLAQRVIDIVDGLAEKWSLATESNYRKASRIGRDAATHFTGIQVVDNWRDRGDQYHDLAMGYLTGDRGLLTDVRMQLLTLIAASVRDQRLVRLVTRQENVDDIDPDAVILAAGAVFARHQFRINHWSGKLVELSNTIFTLGMGEGSSLEEDGETTAVRWMVEWVSVGDSLMCPTCTDLGGRGFVALGTLPTHPGGDTECGGNCRCVLVFWTQQEVDAGEAEPLSNAA